MTETTSARTERVTYTWDELSPVLAGRRPELRARIGDTISVVSAIGPEVLSIMNGLGSARWSIGRGLFEQLGGEFFEERPVPPRHPLPEGPVWSVRLGDGTYLTRTVAGGAVAEFAHRRADGTAMRFLSRSDASDRAQKLADMHGFSVPGAPAPVDVAAVRQATADAVVEQLHRIGQHTAADEFRGHVSEALASLPEVPAAAPVVDVEAVRRETIDRVFTCIDTVVHPLLCGDEQGAVRDAVLASFADGEGKSA